MKTLKELSNLIKLDSNIKIYVPSTINVNTEIENTEKVEQTLKFLSGLFGGATSYNALGCWVSQSEGLVKEKVNICESYTNEKALHENITLVVEYCEKLKKEMYQEAISLEVNNQLYFI